MSTFHVSLKKIVDDSYDIAVGYHLENRLVSDLKNGLVGKLKKFAVVTDSRVKDLYAVAVFELLKEAGYQADLFVFPAGEKSKTRATKEWWRMPCWKRDTAGIAVSLPWAAAW